MNGSESETKAGTASKSGSETETNRDTVRPRPTEMEQDQKNCMVKLEKWLHISVSEGRIKTQRLMSTIQHRFSKFSNNEFAISCSLLFSKETGGSHACYWRYVISAYGHSHAREPLRPRRDSTAVLRVHPTHRSTSTSHTSSLPPPVDKQASSISSPATTSARGSAGYACVLDCRQARTALRRAGHATR